jgi:hypothetical protein
VCNVSPKDLALAWLRTLQEEGEFLCAISFYNGQSASTGCPLQSGWATVEARASTLLGPILACA